MDIHLEERKENGDGDGGNKKENANTVSMQFNHKCKL